MRSHTPKAPLLGVYWLGIQTVWGALLGISLQARTVELVPGDALGAYARMAAIGAFVAALTQVAAGPLSDRLRARGDKRLAFYIGGAVGGAAAVIWFYAAGNLWQLTAAFVFLQFALNVAIGPYQAVIPDVLEPQAYPAASSWMAALQSLGNAVGAVLASVLADARVLGASIAAVLMVSMAVTVAHVKQLQLKPVTVETLRIDRAFADLFISRALVYVGFYTLLGYMFFYVNSTLGIADVRHAKFISGVMILAFTVAGIAGAAAAGRLRRMDQRLAATLGGAGFIAALLAFIVLTNQGAAMTAVIVAGACWGAFLVADWALGCRYVPRGLLATAMGLWNLAVVGPQVLAPIVATAVLSALGALHSNAGPQVAFATASIEVGLGILWVWRLSACVLGE